VYDNESAARWIAANAPEFSAAFSQAFHFAMESDIFRIAYASRLDCIYIDIDSWPIAGISRVLDCGLRSGSSMLYFRAGQPSLNNSFFIARRNCPFFETLVRQCSAIDLSGLPRQRSTILDTFGPGRFISVLHEIVGGDAVTAVHPIPEANGVSAMYFQDGSSLLFANEFATAAQKPPYPLNYKRTDDHWKNVPSRIARV
jgi:hypothetical protein